MDSSFFHQMKRVLRYMETHYWEEIGVEDIAAHIGYSPRYCNYLFKSYYGESLGSYLRTLRMEDAKRALDSGFAVGRVAKSLSYKPRGFLYSFREYYGVSPSEYVKTGKTRRDSQRSYEWKGSEQCWGMGENPTADGLWEFAYYDPETKTYSLMAWHCGRYFFYAPWVTQDDAYYYCRNRREGYSMHPGIRAQAVKSFRCPSSGKVDVFFSVGREFEVSPTGTPCAVQLYHNDVPIGDPTVLTSTGPVFLTATLSVQIGDRIRLHVDSMKDRDFDPIHLYRQRIIYTEIDGPDKIKTDTKSFEKGR